MESIVQHKDIAGLTLVVTKDKDGLEIVQRGVTTALLPSFPANTVDPTGAGDVLVGGTLGSLCQGKSLLEALSVGSAFASICVEGWGATHLVKQAEGHMSMRAAWIHERITRY